MPKQTSRALLQDYADQHQLRLAFYARKPTAVAIISSDVITCTDAWSVVHDQQWLNLAYHATGSMYISMSVLMHRLKRQQKGRR